VTGAWIINAGMTGAKIMSAGMVGAGIVGVGIVSTGINYTVPKAAHISEKYLEVYMGTSPLAGKFPKAV
jgi:hypothetical protein